MSFIKKKIVKASEVRHHAKVSKWVFVDDVLLLLFAAAVVTIGALVSIQIDGTEYNMAIFNIGSFRVRLIFIIGIGLVFLTFLDWLKEFIKLVSTELALTDTRIIGKRGFIAIHILDSQLTSFDSLEVKMGIWGRIFNYGKIILNTKGNSKSVYKHLARPLKFQKAVNEMLDELKRMNKKIIINNNETPQDVVVINPKLIASENVVPKENVVKDGNIVKEENVVQDNTALKE